MKIEREIAFHQDQIESIKLAWGRESRPLWQTLENLPAYQAVKWVDRFSPYEALAAEWATARVFEKAFDFEVPPRAEYLRTVHSEFHRLAWYFNYLGEVFFSLQDRPRQEQALYLREMVFRGMELFSGSRILPHLFSLGGISRDLSLGETRKFLAQLHDIENEFEFFFSDLIRDLDFNERLSGVLNISKGLCQTFNWGGIVGQGSGFSRDLRTTGSYGGYRSLAIREFETSEPDDYGDCRQRVRALEFQVRQSIEICQKALSQMPEGPYQLNTEPKTLWPKGTFVASVEGPSGEVIATLINKKLRISTTATRMASQVENLLIGLHRDDWRLGMASLGFNLMEGDLGI